MVAIGPERGDDDLSGMNRAEVAAAGCELAAGLKGRTTELAGEQVVDDREALVRSEVVEVPAERVAGDLAPQLTTCIERAGDATRAEFRDRVEASRA